MMNINAYLKYKFAKSNMTLESLEMSTKLDKGYLSRVLNNHYCVKKERNLIKICKALDIDAEQLEYKNLDIEEDFYCFFNCLYFISDDRDRLFKKLANEEEKFKTTPYLLNFILVKFAYLTITRTFDSNYEECLNNLKMFVDSAEKDFQSIFYVFYFGASALKRSYEDILQIKKMCDSLNIEDDQLRAMYYYFLIEYNREIGNLDNMFTYYSKCKDLLIETKNNKRLYNLWIIHSLNLIDFGFIKQGIDESFELIHYFTINNSSLNNLYIIHNNIGWGYFLLKDYQKAIEYYEKAIQVREVNEICFEIAYCYFQLKNKSSALEYIKRGKNAKNSSDYYYLLLEWLEAMLNRAYSDKSKTILLRILKNYRQDLTKIYLHWIYHELYEYYKYHHHYDEAFKYADLLIEENIQIPSKGIKKY